MPRISSAARERLDAASWEEARTKGAAMPVEELVAMGETLADATG